MPSKHPEILIKHVRRLLDGLDELERLAGDHFQHDADQLRNELAFIASGIVGDLESLGFVAQRKQFGRRISVLMGAFADQSNVMWLNEDLAEWRTSAKRLLLAAQVRLKELATAEVRVSGSVSSRTQTEGVSRLF